jgi:hypothetical protein
VAELEQAAVEADGAGQGLAVFTQQHAAVGLALDTALPYLGAVAVGNIPGSRQLQWQTLTGIQAQPAAAQQSKVDTGCAHAQGAVQGFPGDSPIH